MASGPTKQRAKDKYSAEGREREQVALALRRAGKSYGQIGEHMEISASRATKLVKRALHRISGEEAADVRMLELSRLDAMIETIWPRVEEGEGRAIELALRVMKRRAEYLGLDEPKTLTQVNVLLEKELNITITKLERALDGETYQRVLSALAANSGPEAAQIFQDRAGDAQSQPGLRALPR